MSAFVYAAVRTPFGRFNGALADVRPDDLAARVIESLLAKAPELDRSAIDEVVWGNANGAGEENRNVGRMAALLAGLPTSVPGTTVNRLCGSSLDAAMVGSRTIETGDADVVLVGGVESMTRAPWVLPKPAKGFPAGDVTAVSTTLGWRLVNPRMPQEWTVSLGECNEQLQEKHGISRERQDAFALRSHRLAAAAWDEGFYDDLVAPIAGQLEGSPATRTSAPTPRWRGSPGSRPASGHDGTITAGNASPLSDGASAVLLGSEAAAARIGLRPARPDRRPRRLRPRPAVLRLRPRRGGQPGAAASRYELERGRRRRAQRGLRRAVAGLRRRLDRTGAEGPGDRQHPGRRDRARAPARRERWPHPRHAGHGVARAPRALRRRRGLHRGRPGPGRGAGERRRCRDEQDGDPRQRRRGGCRHRGRKHRAGGRIRSAPECRSTSSTA